MHDGGTVRAVETTVPTFALKYTIGEMNHNRTDAWIHGAN